MADIAAPTITEVWSPNYWTGRAGFVPVAVVDHIMEGTEASTDGWFKNPQSQASSHFGVSKLGDIHQYVKLTDTAWGNGILQFPDMSVPFIADCAAKDINPNYRTISIEHEGDTGDAFTEAQYQASLALHIYVMTLYNIPPDRVHVVGHYQIMSKDRANCPGTGFPWDRLMADLVAHFHSSPSQTTDITDPMSDPNVWHCLATDKWVTNDQHFLDFWRRNGGLAIFGNPLSGAAPNETLLGVPLLDEQGKPMIVQYFERARFEFHPANPDAYKVLLGRLGAEELASVAQKLADFLTGKGGA